ncbi:MAG: hypothetical protein JST28_09110 [Acidobacteria bacterium]|nr:hypothetical protein [Acidobacteriota bacterium]
MSVAFVLDPASVDETVAYIEEMRVRILQAIREGMKTAMEGLADTTIEEFYAAGLHSRDGQTVENIEYSPKVTETAAVIRGTVAAERDITLGGRKAKHIGLWMEEGTHVPEVKGVLFGFTEPQGNKTLFSRGHKAFDMKPHPFLNPALAKYETTIGEIIEKAVEDAVAA